MGNYLYHFFPRKFEDEETAIAIVKSIFENGLYLSHETRKVDWKDPYAIGGKQRKLEAEQFRFCLTAISNEKELISHSEEFGLIAIEFEEDFILKVGGFPVFYVPTPESENADIGEYKGVSLLYRLADAQQILEHLVKYNTIQTKDIDLENVLGSIKFLANIFYPTQQKTNDKSDKGNYYNQREWRIIHNLTSETVKIGFYRDNYIIEEFQSKPIRNFITKVIVFKNTNIAEEVCNRISDRVQKLIYHFGMNCKMERIKTDYLH